MAQTVAQVRALIRRDTAQLKRLDDVLKRRDARMVQARALGATTEELAADSGLTPMRVRQIAPVKGGRQEQPAASPAAPEPEPEPERAPADVRMPLTGEQLPERFRPGVLASISTLLADYVTDHWAKDQPELATVFVDLTFGDWCSPAGRTGRLTGDGSLAALLGELPERVQRVYLVGARPGTAGAQPGEVTERTRLWFLQPAPGWVAGRHWFPDDGNPIGRYLRDCPGRPELHGQELTITMAADWFGQGDYTVRHAARAWAELRGRVREAFGDGAILLTTPATTGRDLWRRTIGKSKGGKSKEYAVLSEELRALIQSTAGQGRREVIPEGPQEIPGFAQYDMRFAYASLAWGLPVGAPRIIGGQEWEQAADSARTRLLKGRGRWLVTATVPEGWAHVGILPAPAAAPEWAYPRMPGQQFTSWVSGPELALAHQYGWRVQVHEGLAWAEGKPLTTWKDKLTSLYVEMETSEWAREEPRPAKLCRIALRNMVLMSIGAFASREHKVTRHAPMTPEGEKQLPADAPVRIVGDHYEWQEVGHRSEWVKRLDHPEWAAEIWGRCRARLLSAPSGQHAGKVGALHVPPGMVLGMRTDALYLAGDPGWPDDGAIGRFRLESSMAGPMPRPTNDAELSELKQLAAGGAM